MALLIGTDMSTEQTNTIEQAEVYIEETGETVPVSRVIGESWRLDDAVHGIAAKLDGRGYGNFCAFLIAQLNEGRTAGTVGRFAWNVA